MPVDLRPQPLSVKLLYMIKKQGSKYVLYTSDGSRVLGTHDSEADAKAQEIAIEISKRRHGQGK